MNFQRFYEYALRYLLAGREPATGNPEFLSLDLKIALDSAFVRMTHANVEITDRDVVLLTEAWVMANGRTMALTS
jgi:hypothetical protein